MYRIRHWEWEVCQLITIHIGCRILQGLVMYRKQWGIRMRSIRTLAIINWKIRSMGREIIIKIKKEMNWLMLLRNISLLTGLISNRGFE